MRKPRASKLADRPMSIGNSWRQGPHQLAQKLSSVNLASEARIISKIPGPSRRRTPDWSAWVSGAGYSGLSGGAGGGAEADATASVFAGAPESAFEWVVLREQASAVVLVQTARKNQGSQRRI